MNLSTQLLALIQVLRTAAYPECCCQNTTGISRTVIVHTWVVIPGYHNCRHSSSPRQSIMLYENLTYTPHAARVELQRKQYMERRTTENNNNNIR